MNRSTEPHYMKRIIPNESSDTLCKVNLDGTRMIPIYTWMET